MIKEFLKWIPLISYLAFSILMLLTLVLEWGPRWLGIVVIIIMLGLVLGPAFLGMRDLWKESS